MSGEHAEWAMIVLGVTTAVFLVAYGLTAFGGSVEGDPVFWVFAGLFLLYLGWDIRRHLRAIRSRSALLEKPVR